MSVVKARGIVIKETETGEAGKTLTLLLKGAGRAAVSARGARRLGSRTMAGAQLFTYSDFVFFKKGDFLSLTQADVIEGFYPLREDYEKLRIGCYFLELCERTILESVPCDDVLYLLLKSLLALSRGKVSPEYAARAFEFKFFVFMGVAPDLSVCASCGAAAESHAPLFFDGSGALCPACAKLKSAAGIRPMRLSEDAAGAAQSFMDCPTDGLFRLSPSPSSLAELARAAEMFIRNHFDIRLRSLRQ